MTNFSDILSVVSLTSLKLYAVIYITIILISYFGKSFLPEFWVKFISNPRVKGHFEDGLTKDQKTSLSNWSDCKSLKDGCSCKNCPLSFKRYMFRRVLIAFYIYAGVFLFEMLGMIPILAPIGMIASMIMNLSGIWFPLILLSSSIIPLFRLPINTQYIFKGNKTTGFTNLGNDKKDRPFVCGDADSLKKNVINNPDGMKYFATGCSINAKKLCLYSLIPVVFAIIILIIVILINAKHGHVDSKKMFAETKSNISEKLNRVKSNLTNSSKDALDKISSKKSSFKMPKIGRRR